MMETAADDMAAALNHNLDGWCAAMNLRFVTATRDEVIIEWTVGAEHHQTYGIVHGGVHCGVIETAGSVGAAIDAMQYGRSVVGLENQTSFLRAVRQGKLRAVGRPLTRGRTTQVWETTVTDETGRIVATGRVRLLCLEPNREVAGTALQPQAKPAK